MFLLLLVYWHLRHRRQHTFFHESQPLDHKTNNESEQGIRRYRNTLYDTDKGGGGPSCQAHCSTKSDACTELLDIDLEKYEKSPKSFSTKEDRFNEAKQQNTPPEKSTYRKKDINIEIDLCRSQLQKYGSSSSSVSSDSKDMKDIAL